MVTDDNPSFDVIGELRFFRLQSSEVFHLL